MNTNMEKIIKLQDKFILVSDGKTLKAGDCIITYPNEIYQVNQSTCVMYDEKIIAGIPSLPSIDFSLLSEQDCKTIGLVDVEKLAEIDRLNGGWEDSANLPFTSGFERGFKTDQSFNDKMFSEKQVRALVDSVTEFMSHHEPEEFNEWFEKKIQSLQQTSWEVKIEMEEVKCSKYGCGNSECLGGCIHTKSQPKITNNSIKIIKIL